MSYLQIGKKECNFLFVGISGGRWGMEVKNFTFLHQDQTDCVCCLYTKNMHIR